jgi:hypothetical protein
MRGGLEREQTVVQCSVVSGCRWSRRGLGETVGRGIWRRDSILPLHILIHVKPPSNSPQVDTVFHTAYACENAVPVPDACTPIYSGVLVLRLRIKQWFRSLFGINTKNLFPTASQQ